MKIIIAGSRTFNNYKLLCEKADRILQNQSEIMIVSGGAAGADKLGERYAKERGYQCVIMKADWERHGRQAGYKRNVEMANFADGLIAFWNMESRGTKHMIETMNQQAKPVRAINFTGGNN